MSNLELIKSNHDEFLEKYDNIQDKLKKKMKTEMEPTIDESREVYNIILKYIKDHKRKLYGGFALNKLLIAKDPKLAIYGEYDTPDVDCYSPEPLIDITNICDLLLEAGFKHVVGQAAQHKETYNIFVNFQEYLNFSYVPLNVYNAIRFVEIDGYRVVHPWFMMIDFFRMFSDPLGSFWRIEKHHKRYQLLEKTYPLPKLSKEIESPKNIPNLSKDTYAVLDKCFDFLTTLSNALFTGFYAYDYYIYENKHSNITVHTKYINIPYYEVYTTDYVEEAKKVLKFIDTLDNPDDFKYEEHYPLFQFFDYSAIIFYKEHPIVYIYGNNHRCIPFNEVPLVKFSYDEEPQQSKKTIKLGSFDQNILHQLTLLVKARINDDNDENDTIYKYINTVVTLRDQYINKNKVSRLGDGTIYEHLVSDCIGKQHDSKRESMLEGARNRKQGKKTKWIYNPEQANTNFDPSKYRFANSSGNVIVNEKQLKLCDKCDENEDDVSSIEANSDDDE